MIALYEETRDLRLMGGWQQGVNSDLDHAVATVPKIYDALKQSNPSLPESDPFTELADYLKNAQTK